MTLPFSHEQFLDVFARYNAALWPVALLLWVATVVLVARLMRRERSNARVTSALLSTLLAVHWIWAGVAYHVALFRAINPAAAAFGAVFVLQGGLFLWRGAVRRDLEFVADRSAWTGAGLLLVLYALLYPAVGLAMGSRYPELPTFGVPCPTVILTAGLLLLVSPRATRWFAPVVVLWSVLGGSAAFLLGMTADLALPLAGAIVLVHALRRSASPAMPGVS